jgi:hypothetical protein
MDKAEQVTQNRQEPRGRNTTTSEQAATSRHELREGSCHISYTPRTTKRGSHLTGAKGTQRPGEPQPHQVAQAPKQIPVASRRRQLGINTQRQWQGRLDLGRLQLKGHHTKRPDLTDPGDTSNARHARAR